MAKVEKKLESSPDGLTQAEAQRRLTKYGPNEIEEKKTNPILKFLTYFWEPIPWMFEAAVILSGVVQQVDRCQNSERHRHRHRFIYFSQYIAELVPAKVRRSLVAVNMLAITSGIVLPIWWTMPFPPAGDGAICLAWRPYHPSP